MTLAGLRAHRQRLLLAALATLIGTAFVAGTLVLSDTMRANTDRTVIGNAAKIDAAVVTNNQLEKLSPETLQRISAADGVTQAQGLVRGDVTLLNKDGRPSNDQPLGISVTMRANIVEGGAPSSDNEILLAQQTAKNTGYRIGDTITVLDKEFGNKHEVRVSGLMSVAGEGMLALRGAVGFTLPMAEKMTGESSFSEIYVKGANPENLRAELARIVGKGPYEVYTGQEFAEQQAAGSGIDPVVLRSGLLMFALVALLVAAFVIYNTFSILVAQRTRELALLRCVGASRRQVFISVLTESAGVGLVASVLGLAVGIAAGYGIIPVMNAFGAGIPADAFTITPTTVAVSLLAGLLTTVVAALIPARAATRVAPVAALKSQPEQSSYRANKVRVTAAVLLFAVGASCAVGGLRYASGKQYPLILVSAGGVIFFLGIVALGPIIIRSISHIVGYPFSRLLGVPGKLAVANARRNPKRAATTIMALTIGVTLTTGVSVITKSLESSVDVGVGEAIPVDYMITPPGTNANVTLPRSLAADIRGHHEVTQVTQVREAPVTVAGKNSVISTVDGPVETTVLKGTLQGLKLGEVALRPERARELGVDVGDPVQFALNGKTVTVTVGGLVTGKIFPRMYLPPQSFEQYFPGRGDSAVLVNLAQGTDPGAARAVIDAATTAFPTAKVVQTSDAKDRLAKTLNQVTMIITGMLALAVIISLVGIANTMTLSVLERSRESALLRALGLANRQLRLMLTTEALIFGVIGGLLGVGLGIVFGLAAARVINDNIVIGLPYWQIVFIIAGSGLAGMIAAVLPARRATRGSIVQSLASD